MSYALDRSREILGDGEHGEDKHGENEGSNSEEKGGEENEEANVILTFWWQVHRTFRVWVILRQCGGGVKSLSPQ